MVDGGSRESERALGSTAQNPPKRRHQSIGALLISKHLGFDPTVLSLKRLHVSRSIALRCVIAAIYVVLLHSVDSMAGFEHKVLGTAGP